MLEDSTRSKIIKAVLKLMGSKEGRDISVREILSEAGMSNMSAISYHFGSKENLIKQALQSYYSEMYSVMTADQPEDSTGKEVLVGLAIRFWEFISKNPGLEKTMLTRMIMQSEPDPDFKEAMKQNLEAVKTLIKQVTRIDNEKELTHRVIMLMSGIVYPFLLKHYAFDSTKQTLESDLHDYFVSLIDGVTR